METLLDWSLVWIIINTIYKGLVIVPNKRISTCRCPDAASAVSPGGKQNNIGTIAPSYSSIYFTSEHCWVLLGVARGSHMKGLGLHLVWRHWTEGIWSIDNSHRVMPFVMHVVFTRHMISAPVLAPWRLNLRHLRYQKYSMHMPRDLMCCFTDFPFSEITAKEHLRRKITKWGEKGPQWRNSPLDRRTYNGISK